MFGGGINPQLLADILLQAFDTVDDRDPASPNPKGPNYPKIV